MTGLEEMASGLLGIALYLVPGLGLSCFSPALEGRPWARRLAFAYLLGIAAVPAALWFLSLAFEVPIRRPAILGVSVGLAALGALWRGLRGYRRGRGLPDEGPARPPARDHLPRWQQGVVVVLALIAFGLLAQASTRPLADFDGRMTWAANARYLRESASVRPAALAVAPWSVSHPRYPLLLPLAQVGALELTQAAEDSPRFRALYVAFLPALLLVAYDGARRFAGRQAAALAALALGVLPFVTFRGEGGALTAYSDLPLAAFFGGGLVLLLGARRPGDGLLAGVLLAGAALAKNEGTPLALAALALVGWMGARRWLRRRRTERVATAVDARVPARRPLLGLSLAATPVALALVLLAAWRAPIPNRLDESYAGLVQLDRLFPEIATRIPELAPLLWARTTDWSHWWGYWIVFAMLLAVSVTGLRRRFRPLALPLALAALAPLAVGWLAYTVHWDAPLLARVTWERFLLQAAVPSTLCLALALHVTLRRAALRTRSEPTAGETRAA